MADPCFRLAAQLWPPLSFCAASHLLVPPLRFPPVARRCQMGVFSLFIEPLGRGLIYLFSVCIFTCTFPVSSSTRAHTGGNRNAKLRALCKRLSCSGHLLVPRAGSGTDSAADSRQEEICLDSANHSPWQAGCWEPGTDGSLFCTRSLQGVGARWYFVNLSRLSAFRALRSHQARLLEFSSAVTPSWLLRFESPLHFLPCWGRVCFLASPEIW